MKKIIALAVAVFLFTTIGIFPASADEEISAVLSSETPKVSNMTVHMPTGGTVTTSGKDGKTGWALSLQTVVDSHILTNASLYANIDDDVMYRLSGAQTVCVEVEYLDVGKGSFCIGYDSTTVSEKSGGTIKLENSNTWKTAEFELERPFFGNRLNGNDFVIRLKSDYMEASAGDVVIASVKVYLGNKRPLDIKIGSEEAGNIFFNAQKPTLNVRMKNLDKKDYTFDIRYEVTDVKSGEQVFNLENRVRINSHTTYNRELDFDGLKFGIYEVTVTAETGDGYTSTAKSEFSRVKSPDATDPDYGACLHFAGTRSEDDTNAALELIERGGFKYARDALHWNNVETEVGVYKIPENTMRDIDLANSKGIDILLILGYVNNTAYPDLRHYTKMGIDASQAEAEFKAYLDAYEDYVYNTVLLLGDKVKYYEVGNEYNLENANTLYPDEGIHNEVTDYAKILERAYRAIKRANPDAVVVGGALAQMVEGGKTCIPKDYITELYELGAADWMDALSVHFYTEHILNDPKQQAPDGTGYAIHDELSDVRDIIGRYGSKQELWVSEYSWISENGRRDQNTQAVYAAKSEILHKAKGLIDKSFWYTLASSLPASDDSYNISYGLLNSMSDKNEEVSVTFAAKPAYLAVSAHKSILAGTEFAEDLSCGDNFIYRFTDDLGKFYYALWNRLQDDAVTLDTEFKEILVYDMYGNAQKLSSDTGSFEISIGTEPVYVSEYTENMGTSPVDNYGKYELTGSLDTDEELRVTIAVLKPNKTYADFKENPLLSMAYMDQVKTDKDGKFTTQFKLNDGVGEYTIVIKPEGRQESVLTVTRTDDGLIPATLGFACDFEDFDKNTAVTGDVLVAKGWNGADGTVGIIVDDSEHGQCLYWSSGAKAGFNLGKKITSGMLTISFSFKQTNEGLYGVALSNETTGYTLPGDPNNRAFMGVVGSGLRASTDGKMASYSSASIGLIKDVWYKIRYEVDMDSWNFNCYVNDTLLPGGPYDLCMTNKENGVQSLFFYLNNPGEFYIDDIVVKHVETESNVNDGFALGDLKIEANNAEITDVVTDGNITVTIKALNETGYTKKINLVYASYCGDKLVDVKVMPTDIAALPDVQKIISEEYTVKDGLTITETKAFVWDDTKHLTPLHPSVKYPK